MKRRSRELTADDISLLSAEVFTALIMLEEVV